MNPNECRESHERLGVLASQPLGRELKLIGRLMGSRTQERLGFLPLFPPVDGPQMDLPVGPS